MPEASETTTIHESRLAPDPDAYKAPEGQVSADHQAMELIWDGFEKARTLLVDRAPGVELKCIIEIKAVIPEPAGRG